MAVRAAMAVPIAPVFMTTKEAEEEAAAMEQEPSRAGQIDDGRGFLAHPSTGGCQVVDLDGLSLFAVCECVCVCVCVYVCAQQTTHDRLPVCFTANVLWAASYKPLYRSSGSGRSCKVQGLGVQCVA